MNNIKTLYYFLPFSQMSKNSHHNDNKIEKIDSKEEIVTSVESSENLEPKEPFLEEEADADSIITEELEATNKITTHKASDVENIDTTEKIVEEPIVTKKSLANNAEKEEEIHTSRYAVDENYEEPKQKWYESTKFQWIVFGLAVLLCGAIFLYKMFNTHPVAINPTTAPITFQVDGKEYSIKANDVVEVKIGQGEHSVTMNGKEVGKFNKGWMDQDSIINPTMSPFVEEQVIYTTNGNPEAYKDKVNWTTITIDGEQYEGPFRLIDPALYVKKTWDYAPWEGSPDSVRTKSHADYVIKKELYTVPSFKASFVQDPSQPQTDALNNAINTANQASNSGAQAAAEMKARADAAVNAAREKAGLPPVNTPETMNAQSDN